MIRKTKRYVKPRKPFEAQRIKDENVLVKKYGLKNKREIWKTTAKVTYYRTRAKDLAKSSAEEQELFFKKLQALGLKVNSIADVLDLKIENLLDRRLTTVLVNKGIATTMKQARQMVTHKKVRINGKVMDAPGYIVPVKDENTIEAKKIVHKKVEKKKENEENGQEDVQESSSEEAGE